MRSVVLALVLGGCAMLGSAERGRDVFMARDAGHCVLCHSIPGVEAAGNVGPPLAGIGSRLATGQIRERVADISRFKADAAMPAFHRTADLRRVAPQYAGRPVLSDQQLNDVATFLSTLK